MQAQKAFECEASLERLGITINATRLQISDTNLKFPQGEWKFAIHIMEKVKRHSNFEELRLKSVIRILFANILTYFV